MTDGSGRTHRECSRKKPTVWAPLLCDVRESAFLFMAMQTALGRANLADSADGGRSSAALAAAGQGRRGTWNQEGKTCCNWNRN